MLICWWDDHRYWARDYLVFFEALSAGVVSCRAEVVAEGAPL